MIECGLCSRSLTLVHFASMSSTQSNGSIQPGADEFAEKEVLPGVYLTDFRPTEHLEPISVEFPLVARLDGDDFVEEEDFDAPPITTKEKQLAPGVYMTDFRDRPAIGQQQRNTSFGAPVFPSMAQFDHPELADARVQELMNSIRHLERSNTELEEMKETDPDPIWQETIEENLGVIARQKAEIYQILTSKPIDKSKHK